ncbi:MAG: metal-dependent hydrolase, beta-lactamase superfamily [Planctomycetaceae bacterium]|nr:metal-dependent hydrolase, beta-lactamase superfamily [Planctomycetaceae bacterium]
MKLQIIPSGMLGETRYQYLVSYVVNDRIAVDAGCLGFGFPLAAQKLVTDLFLSHCHLDHVATLPIFLDNVFEHGPECVVVHGSEETLSVLQQDILNDRLWPDFVSLSTPDSAFLKLNELTALQPVPVGDMRVTPLSLIHVVPVLGFLIEDPTSAVAIISDTYHGSGVWQHIAQIPNLKAVLLECSFPDQLVWLADKALHLIPKSFAAEIQSLPKSVRVIAIHIKPAWYEAVVDELLALGLPNIEIGQTGIEYQF